MKSKIIITFGITLALGWACRKNVIYVAPTAALNLVNATVGEAAVKVNWTNVSNKSTSQYYSQISTAVGYGTNYVYGVLSGQAIPMTVVATTDTVNAIFKASLNLSRGGIYSLFLAGNVSTIDTVFIQESIPVYGDSSCGVRFINLVSNSNPIFIRQTSTPTVTDFSSIGYKQYTSFKQYPAAAANKSYSFQVVDGTTNGVLATYVLTTPYFHNVTLAWIGQAGGTGAAAPKVIRINNY